MEITYDYYRMFYYVATYQSFSKAAKILMSNQPNITRFINNLENQLGCKLFVRSNRGVQLTQEGRKLYQHVSVAYQHLHMAEVELMNEQRMDRDILRSVQVRSPYICCYFRFSKNFIKIIRGSGSDC